MTEGNKKLVLSNLEGTSGKGLECKHCGCRHLDVYRTINQAHKVIRYRKCRHCGHSVKSVERLFLKGSVDTCP